MILYPTTPTLTRRRSLETKTLTKTWALGIASFLSFWQSSPQSVHMAAVGASLLIILDTIFGVGCAAFFKEFRSRLLRERLVAKFAYYSLFVLCSYIVAGLLQAHWVQLAAWWAILLIELASVGETLTRLHIRGGKRFGPAEKVLKLIANAMGEAAQAALPQEDKTDGESPDTKDKQS